MPKLRFSAEQIVVLLRQIEEAMGQGKSIQIASWKSGVLEQSYYLWRKEFGGLSDFPRMRESSFSWTPAIAGVTKRHKL